MKLIDPNELFSSLEQLDPAIKDKGKIPDIDATYTEFIHRYAGVSLTPDIVLYGYQRVLEWNRRARGDGLPEDLLLIGQSGQGDEWFLSARRKTVFFFDHDQGGVRRARELPRSEDRLHWFSQDGVPVGGAGGEA